MRPPVRVRNFENTSRSATTRASLSPSGTAMPARRCAAQRSPTRFAHRKMRRLTALPVRAFSSTRPYTFSYTRGTATTTVGRTSSRFCPKASTDSA